MAKPPTFTLTADDALAPILVDLWAALHERGAEALMGIFAELNDVIGDLPKDDPRIAQALRISEAMQAYRTGHPFCRICLCTEIIPCQLPNGQPCNLHGTADGDELSAVCSNPTCRRAVLTLVKPAASCTDNGLPPLDGPDLNDFEGVLFP